MSSKCETDDFNEYKNKASIKNKMKTVPLRGNGEGVSSEETPLIAGQTDNANIIDNKDSKGKWGIFPKISQKSRVVLIKLCLLFAVDSFSSGLVPGYVFSFLSTLEPLCNESKIERFFDESFIIGHGLHTSLRKSFICQKDL